MDLSPKHGSSSHTKERTSSWAQLKRKNTSTYTTHRRDWRLKWVSYPPTWRDFLNRVFRSPLVHSFIINCGVFHCLNAERRHRLSWRGGSKKNNTYLHMMLSRGQIKSSWQTSLLSDIKPGVPFVSVKNNSVLILCDGRHAYNCTTQVPRGCWEKSKLMSRHRNRHNCHSVCLCDLFKRFICDSSAPKPQPVIHHANRKK